MKEKYLIKAHNLLPPKKFLSGERNEILHDCTRVVARLLEDIDKNYVTANQYSKTKKLLEEMTRQRDALLEGKDPMNELTGKFPGGGK